MRRKIMKNTERLEMKTAESVFAFRRKGLDDFCTCSEKRYKELSLKPNLFETCIFYTAPESARQPLTDKQIQDVWCSAKNEGNQHGPFWFARAIERAHGITGETQDPVKHCLIYKAVGCAHVDGMLCNMKTCNIVVNLELTPNTIKEVYRKGQYED